MENSSARSNSYDVAVIGGGPAGATVSTFLAQRGRRVALVEKNQHPRFHVGESLLPKNLPVIDRMGLSREISEIGVYKPGAEFVSAEHDDRQSFCFSEAIDPTPPYAYQVRRSDFDEILFRHAGTLGVDIREGHTVTASERVTGGWRMTTDGPDGPDEISARYLVDASGREGFMARKHNLRSRDRDHNSAALFAHYKEVNPDSWEVPGNIVVFWFDHGWIWMIPLPDGVTSVGAVCMPDYLKTRTNDLDEFFEDTLRLCPKAWDVLKGATRVSPVHGAGNYAYRTDCPFGDGYLALGDAYAFVDPVFSSGVLLAMTSAENAAQVIDVMLDDPARAPSLQRRYQKDLDRAINRISWFVHRFNTPALKTLFMRPHNPLGVKTTVLSVLTGDLYRGPWFECRLAAFKVLYHVSRLKTPGASRMASARRRQLPAISMPENESSADAQTL